MSSTNTAIDLALASMLASYINPEPATSAEVSAKVVKAATAKARETKGSKPLASNGAQAKVVTPKVQPALTGDPKSPEYQAKLVATAPIFLQALRKAETRNDRIEAIALFVGFDHSQDFGSQEMRAKMLAQSAGKTYTGPSRQEQRVLQASVRGYVAGVPDHKERAKADLLARERLAVETMLECEKRASEATTDQERMVQSALAMAERERLTHIRRDLASF